MTAFTLELWTAFLLGLVGSLHCAGMCGPLALALPRLGGSPLSFRLGRIGYNLGRITAYASLGVFFGGLGQTVAMAGFQRYASVLAGIAVLAVLIPLAQRRLGWPATQVVGFLKSSFSALLQRRTLSALYLLGLFNGFLPCGLVYAACAGTLALGSVLSGLVHMLAFGLGTVPMMLGIGLLGKNVQLAFRYRPKLMAASLALLGILLVLRGLSLDSPYLSPSASGGPPAVRPCH